MGEHKTEVRCEKIGGLKSSFNGGSVAFGRAFVGERRQSAELGGFQDAKPMYVLSLLSHMQ